MELLRRKIDRDLASKQAGDEPGHVLNAGFDRMCNAQPGNQRERRHHRISAAL